MSKLGLDVLAQQRREERERKGEEEKMRPPSKRANADLQDEAKQFLKKRRVTNMGKEIKREYTPSPEREDTDGGRHTGYKASEWTNTEEARMWYEGGDEFGGGTEAVDLEGQNLENAYSKKRLEERQENMRKSMAKSGRVKQASLRTQQRNEEADKWEESRMFAGGAIGMGEVDQVDDDLDANMIRLIVKKPTPSFLAAGVVFSKRSELVLPVKDIHCDLYEAAKKGSDLLRFVREQKDRQKADRDSLDNSGTVLGNLDNNGVDRSAQLREERRRAIRERKAMTKEELEQEEIDEAKKNTTFSASAKSAQWSGVSEFSRMKMKQQRESLPVFEYREAFLKMVRENNIIVVVGETGSGKTTQLAQYLFEDGYCTEGSYGSKRMVGCTQPRRVAAMSVAKRVSEEVGCELGDKVGYSIRFEDCTSEGTLVKYMTDGVLLRETMRDPDINQYSAIIMDEAHERSLNTDVLFGILKTCVGRRRDLKLIVTSATMDYDKFSGFFCNCPVFKIHGRTFPVDIFYQQTNVSDYVNSVVKQAITIHLTSADGDILIFMTGQEEIEVSAMWIEKKLRESNPESADTLMILPIYSLLPSEMQAKIFDPAPPGVRKCIIATNIAETSLTVDGIYFVIDSGFCKLKLFNPKTGMDSLQVFPESQAAAKQRSGRAGRTGPGKCFRMYTQYQFEHEMLPMTVPEIQRTSLSSVILLLKSLGVKNLLHFEFMDPPPQDNMTNSMYQLWMLGALNDKGDLTQVGHDMNEFPVDPAMAKCLLFASSGSSGEENCAEEVLTVVACLSSQSKIFLRPKQQEELADQMREKFVVAESDHLTLLNAFQMFKMNGRSQRWCSDHFINYKAIKRVEEVRVQLKDILQKKKKKIGSCGGDWDPVKRALCAGYFINCGKRRGVDDYYSMLTGVPCCVHPSSALFNGGMMPDYVIYHELIYTQKEYMNTVSVIDGNWMTEIAPKFFEIRGERFRQQVNEPSDDEGSDREHDLTALTNEGAIEAVLSRRKKPKQEVVEAGRSPAQNRTPGRRSTPGRTPSALARPGTPGYRRRGM
eukprot:TRINITY_DN34023_c0_g1_i1.p1 TRINITY_DN34023_c0_g1~~TRINITY_DN34023_c0_g1_i1.p1  ORF type:complete len:1063 (+),score=318.19 TRINITY_DN34023_c0_g1_i1:46-3189(+)